MGRAAALSSPVSIQRSTRSCERWPMSPPERALCVSYEGSIIAILRRQGGALIGSGEAHHPLTRHPELSGTLLMLDRSPLIIDALARHEPADRTLQRLAELGFE